MSKFQKVPVKCPSCKQPFVAQIYHVVDAATDPGLKYQLLSGKLNTAACPSCGMAGMLGMPFAYHDPDKEILFVFVPTEAGLNANDQQKLIGSLSQDVLNSLAPEKRKAYLLQPQTFFRLPTMIDAILLKDGITPEILERQKKRSAVINEMLQTLDDEPRFQSVVEAHRDELDYEFYAMLTGTAEAAAEGGDDAFANRILTLRARLLGQGAPAEATAPEGSEEVEDESAEDDVTPAELLERLLNAKDDQEFEALVVVGRPLIDYAFYLDIANRADAAQAAGQTDEAGRLIALRDRLLQLTAELDAEAEQAIKESTELLRQLITAEDPASVMEAHAEDLDDLFFYVLSSNIHQLQKEQAGPNDPRLARLNYIANLAAAAVEKRMPPRLRLINQLLRAPDDAARLGILDGASALVTPELLGDVDALIGQFTDERQDVARRLTDLKGLLQARLG
jgi:hypothetical protein